MNDERAPSADLLEEVTTTLGRFRARGEDAVYEVDVIIACHPAPAWDVSRAFRTCVERGLLEPSAGQPAAFTLSPRHFLR